MVRHYTQAFDVFVAFTRGSCQVLHDPKLILKAWDLQRNAFVQAREYTGMPCFAGSAYIAEVCSIGCLAKFATVRILHNQRKDTRRI